jgi:hypothetical protein
MWQSKPTSTGRPDRRLPNDSPGILLGYFSRSKEFKVNEAEPRATGFRYRTAVYLGLSEPGYPEPMVRQSWKRRFVGLLVAVVAVTLLFIYVGPSWGVGALTGVLIAVFTPYYRRSVAPRYERWEARRGRSGDRSSA